jgi:hypothetical protein
MVTVPPPESVVLLSSSSAALTEVMLLDWVMKMLPALEIVVPNTRSSELFVGVDDMSSALVEKTSAVPWPVFRMVTVLPMAIVALVELLGVPALQFDESNHSPLDAFQVVCARAAPEPSSIRLAAAQAATLKDARQLES